MKILTIILLLISFNLSAQSYDSVKFYKTDNDKYKVIGMSIIQTIADATGDALMDSNRKELGHLMNAGTIGLFVIEPALIHYDSWRDVGIKAVSLTCTRILLFNLTYNAVRGLPLSYYGTTSYYDQFWSLQPVNGWGTKVGFFVVGIDFTINYW